MAIKKVTLPNGDSYDINDARVNTNIRSYTDATGTAGSSSTGGLTPKVDITDSEITSYVNGMIVAVKLPIASVSTYGLAIQINSLGYHPVVSNINTTVGSRYGLNSTIVAVYNSTQTATSYITSGSTATTVTGAWQVMDYDSNTVVAYGQSEYYFRPYASTEAIYRYKLVSISEQNRIVPIVVTNQTSATQVAKVPTQQWFRPDQLWFYNSTTTVSASGKLGGNGLARSMYTSGAAYTFNTTIPAYCQIYLRGTYDADKDLFQLYKDSSSPCTSYYVTVPANSASTVLSNYFVSGYYYILVGGSYSSNDYFSLYEENKLYYFDGTNLVDGYTAKCALKSEIPVTTAAASTGVTLSFAVSGTNSNILTISLNDSTHQHALSTTAITVSQNASTGIVSIT